MILLVMAYFLILAYPLAFRIYQRVIQGTLPPHARNHEKKDIIAHDRTMHDTHTIHDTRHTRPTRLDPHTTRTHRRKHNN
jgi:hypothetical protein